MVRCASMRYRSFTPRHKGEHKGTVLVPSLCLCEIFVPWCEILVYDFTQSAPTILVVPTDHHVVRVYVAPPGFKLRARDVERGWRHQVIKDDRVLLAPAKLRECAQVVVEKKILPEGGAVMV